VKECQGIAHVHVTFTSGTAIGLLIHTLFSCGSDVPSQHPQKMNTAGRFSSSAWLAGLRIGGRGVVAGAVVQAQSCNHNPAIPLLLQSMLLLA
jgi:hypothetical protein